MYSISRISPEEDVMHRIEIDYQIAQSPDVVFAFLTDFNQLTRWRTLEECRLEPAGAARVGTRLLTKVRGLGRPMQFTNEIVELDSDQRVFRDRALDGTFLIQSSWQVSPHDTGSRLRWVTEFEARGLMAVLTPILRRAIRQGQLQDLAKVKALLEHKDTIDSEPRTNSTA
jgi:uncharacterized protein YndB with AHSA1/START domain